VIKIRFLFSVSYVLLRRC